MADNTALNAMSGGDSIATDDIGGVKYQRVKVGYGADGSYTDAAADAGLPVAAASATFTGSVTSNNADIVPSTDASNYQMASVQFPSAPIAGVQLQGSNDNSSWVPILTSLVSGSSIGVPNQSSMTPSPSQWYVGAVPTRYVRLRTNAYSSGTVTATLRLYNGASSGLLPSSMNVTPNSAAAVSDGASQSAWAAVTAVAVGYNGSTYDRWRNNQNTTTGDTGAKTANFLGATQTNYNARGAYITIVIGTVTGTVSTFQSALQWSYDGGTTWLPLTALGTNLTPTSGNTIVWHIAPGVASQTPATSAGVSAATQYNYVNAALPRTWRIGLDIAGSTPSVTISSVNVNYIV